MTDPTTLTTDQYDILIVDDVLDNLEFLGRILDEQGYRVRPAPNGRLALESVAARLPDLILLDVKMPEMDGYEVCRRLKANEQSRNVPVIFISAYHETANKVEGFKAGGVDYIAKPFEREEVLARVESQLRLRKLTEHLEQEVNLRTAELTRANQQLQEDINERRRNERINAARIHLMQFAATHSLDELLEETVNEVEKVTDSLIGFYHFVEDDQESLTLQNWSTRTKAEFCKAEGKGMHYPIADAGVWVDCVHERKPVIHNDYASLPHRKGMPEGHAEVVRELVVPVMRGEKIKAILGVGNKPTDYSQKDVEAMSLMADLVWEITERKRGGQQIALMSFALNGIHEGAFLIDENACLQYVNEEACRLLGYSRDEMLGMTVPNINAEFSMERWHGHWSDLKEHGALTFEGELKTRDGGLVPVEINANYFEYEGRSYDLGLVRDITERKRMEETLFFVAQRGWLAGAENFFDTLAQFLGEKLAMDYVFIARIDENPDMAETVALYAKGAMVANMCYALKGTPCENVVGQKLCVYPQGVQQLFPEDTLLVEMGVENYIGVPLWDSSGRPIGLIALMGCKPLSEEVAATQVLQLVATRVAAELERKRSDSILRAREHEFRTLAESLPDNLARYDREGRVVYINPVLEKTLGIAAADRIGRCVRESNPDGSYEAYAQAVDAALTSGENGEIEFIVPVPSKEPIVHQIRMIPERDEHGEVAGVLAIGRDITERKKSEAQILASEQLFRALVENSPDFIARYDRDFRPIYVNPAIQKLFGGQAGEIFGKTPADQSPISAPQAYIDHLRQTIENGTESSEEIPFRTAQGEMHWGHIRFVPEFGPDGQVETVLTIGRDIHDIKEREQRFRMLAENFPDFIARFDRDGHFTYVNPSVEKASGMPADAIVGKTLLELPQRGKPEQNDAQLALIRRAFDEGVANESEARWDTELGERVFEIRHTPEKDAAGNVVSVLGIAHDVTEQKRAEQERLASLRFFESMDKVNQAMQKADDLEQMMKDVLDVVLSVFDCDRVCLMYPCDPEAPTWTIPMERNKPEYPGVWDLKGEMPMDPQVAETQRILLAADGPLTFGPGSQHALPEDVSKQFNIKSFMSMAIFPKNGSPWHFGIHQYAYARVWTAEEERLFEAIGRRLADGLTSLLSYRDLGQNEKFLENVVEHIPNMIFIKDARTLAFVRFNKAGEQLVGYPREELLGKTDYDFFPKEEADFFTQKDRQVLASKEMADIPEETIQNRSNEKRILHTKKIPILDETGTPQYLLGISEDITERKQAEVKMLRSEQRLRLHREQSPLGFLEWDENFRSVEWNAACERIFGYTREEAIGRHAKDLILPEEIHELCDGIYQSLMNQAGGQHSINKNITKDGRTIICEWFNTTLVDKDGNSIGVSSICKDITEQIQAEESIRKLSQAIEQSPVSIVITDLEGSIEFVNAKFTQITGYTYAEALGQNPRVLKSDETSAEEYNQLWKTISSGGVWRGEFHNRKKNGELFWEYATIAPIRDADGVITHYVAVKEDITERKKLEEQFFQSQKMEAVGQLAGGVAHDFNNMLGVIIGHAQMALEHKALESSLREDLDEILAAGLRSAEITRQLLAFARKQSMAPQILDLNETVEGMLKLLRRLIGEDIDLAWLPGARLWPVKMDPSQVDQILANLCVNARDAIAGAGKITIETQNVDCDDAYCAEHEGFSPGEYVLLTVSDNGKGMDKSTLDKIFEPFFTTKGLGQGTGLGLSTVYGIVKQNAGFINVYSEPGHGSTFKIYLSRHTGDTEQIGKESPVAPTIRGYETILVVEDDSLFLNMVKQMLKKLGYVVWTSSNPNEAIRFASENPGKIDLLITDMVMPEMTGLDLEKKLKSLIPELKCLIMSGYTGDVIAQHGALDESANFIQKPFSKEELAAKVREVLDSK